MATQGLRRAQSLANAWFKILGANTKGTSPSILLVIEKSRYLFNCGENLRRLFMEINVESKVKCLKGIFLTRPLWDRFSSIYNYTSLQLLLEMGEKETPNFKIFSANMDSVIGSLINSEKDQYNKVDVSTGQLYEDKDIIIEPILIEKWCEDGAKMADTKKPFLDNFRPKNENVTVAYYGELYDIFGKVDVGSVKKCGLENKSKLIYNLVRGCEVSLPSGRVVKPEECVGPRKLGASFLILECPNKEFITPILRCEKLEKLRNSKERILKVLVHLVPQSVVDTSEYSDWMKSFGDKTEHLIVLTDKKERIPNFGQKVRCVLNLVSPTFYPIRKRTEKTAKQPNVCENMHIVDDLCNYHLHRITPIGTENKPNLVFVGTPNQSECLEDIYKQIEESFEFHKIHVYKQDLINTTENTNKRITPLEHYREFMDNPHNMDLTPLKGDPLVIFLGTGASVNSCHRSTPCILILDAYKNSYMLDCGEGSFMQIWDKFGENTSDVLAGLKVIFVSHRHTDHLTGLIRVLSEREKVVGKRDAKILIIGPTILGDRLRFYSANCEELSYDFLQLRYTERGLNRQLCKQLRLRSLQGVRVKHCYDSFGVSIVHKEGWKIVYSGDTRPVNALAALGQNCDLLIHEATFEKGFEKKAIFKKHSTTSEAIKIAEKMGAKFTILTHFSSRYTRLPKFEEDFVSRNFAVAFDLMTVRLSQLPHLITAQKCIREIVPKFLKQTSQLGPDTWASLDSWDPYEDEDFCS